MPELNDLLLVAVDRCQKIGQDAVEAGQAIEEMVQNGEALAGAIVSEGQEIRQRLQSLTAKLDEAEGTLEGAGGQAKAALDSLVSRAQQVQAAVTETLGNVKSDLAELEARKGELAEALTGKMDSADADVEQLQTRVQELQTAISQSLEAAHESLQGLTDATGTAREEWHTSKDQFLTALDALGQRAQARTEAYRTEIEDLLDNERVELLVERLANNLLIAKHNATIDSLGEAFEAGAPARLASTLTPLRTALESLKDLCGQHAAALGVCSSEIQARVGAAVERIERITPGVEAVKAIG